MSSLAIRIIGGVCGGAIGTYVSGKIYDYVYNKKEIENTNSITKTKSNVNILDEKYDKKYENKISNVKSFEELLNIQIMEQLRNNKERIINYEYDNEHGNTIEINPHNLDTDNKENVNNYDISFESFYRALCRE